MDLKKNIHVAVVDACEFTAIGLDRLINSEPHDKLSVQFHSFTHLAAMYEHNMQYEIIVYDPLNPHHFLVNIDTDVSTIRKHQPRANIYIYSAGVGFLKQSRVDGMFNKRISLSDLKALWLMAINKLMAGSGRFNMNITVAYSHSTSCLTNEEVSVLRGYSCNLTTRQIAGVLRCNIKLVYFYKKSAMAKLEAARGPTFYQQIRCILN